VGWIEAFVWTCAIEAPVYILFLRGCFRSAWAPVGISLGLQLATHPLQWMLFPGRANTGTMFLLVETGVALVEGLLVALVLWRRREPRPLLRGLLAGFLANVLSASFGILVQRDGAWFSG
jgi:hypothetical protein